LILEKKPKYRNFDADFKNTFETKNPWWERNDLSHQIKLRSEKIDLISRAFRTRPFRRTRTQTEVRNSDSDLRNRDFPTP
jgi:hypothetical protein